MPQMEFPFAKPVPFLDELGFQWVLRVYFCTKYEQSHMSLPWGNLGLMCSSIYKVEIAFRVGIFIHDIVFQGHFTHNEALIWLLNVAHHHLAQVYCRVATAIPFMRRVRTK